MEWEDAEGNEREDKGSGKKNERYESGRLIGTGSGKVSQGQRKKERKEGRSKGGWWKARRKVEQQEGIGNQNWCCFNWDLIGKSRVEKMELISTINKGSQVH